jgi:hypothetical protein
MLEGKKEVKLMVLFSVEKVLELLFVQNESAESEQRGPVCEGQIVCRMWQ